MSLHPERALWSGAISASLLIHAGIAAMLAIAPLPEPQEPRQTTFAIRSAPHGFAVERDSQPVAVPAAQPVMPKAVEAPAAQPADSVAPRATQAEPVERLEASLATDMAAGVQSEPVAPAGDSAEPVTSPRALPAETIPQPTMAEAPPIDTTAAVAPRYQSEPSSAPTEVAVASPVARPEASLPTPTAQQAAPAASPVRVETGRTSPVETPTAPAANSPDSATQVVASVPTHAAPTPDAVEPQAVPSPTAAEQPASVALPETVDISRATPAEPGSAPQAPAPDRAAGAVTARNPSDTEVAVVRPVEPEPAERRESLARTYERVLDAILGEAGYPCFLALASTPGGAIAVDGFSTDRNPIERLGRRIGRLIQTPFALRGHIVSNAQCAALAFTRDLESYPQLPLTIELASREIASGAELSGRIANIDHNWVYLVVVDDVGKVQEIEDLTLDDAGTVGFDVPLTLTEGPAGTVQLLVAVASDEILETIWLREGDRAETYFERLGEEIRRGAGQVAFGVASFVITQ